MSEHTRKPVEFVVDERRTTQTYSLPIFNAIDDWGGYALVEWVAPQTYAVTGGFSDTWQVREHLESRTDIIGARVYFYEPGTWFGQVFVPEPGREWPHDDVVRRFARRAQIIQALGLPAPAEVGHCDLG